MRIEYGEIKKEEYYSEVHDGEKRLFDPGV